MKTKLDRGVKRQELKQAQAAKQKTAKPEQSDESAT